VAKSITRRIALTLGTALVVHAGFTPAASAVRRTDTAISWLDAPALAELFVPANLRDSYSVSVTPASLENVLASVGTDEALVRAPGAWQVRDENAQDVFGTGAAYNRWLLARLYGSRLTRVVRGARADRGRVVEAWTLVSPYPSADLRTLQPGTMRLILKLVP